MLSDMPQFCSVRIIEGWLELLTVLPEEAREIARSQLAKTLFAAQVREGSADGRAEPELLSRIFVVPVDGRRDDLTPSDMD